MRRCASLRRSAPAPSSWSNEDGGTVTVQQRALATQ
jgi:hypothetical protein